MRLWNILGVSVEQIIIYTERMIGVGSMRPIALPFEHQSVGTENVKEPVTAEDEFITEELTTQMV